MGGVVVLLVVIVLVLWVLASCIRIVPVSYTHLTLPTILRV